jgi:proline iminopeptidase
VSTFVTGDGIRLFYEQVGQGPPVYTCCGGPANDHRYLAEDLAPLQDEFELVHHDYRGSGQSDAAPTSTYTFERLADDLDELRRSLGDETITVLTHSMGGFVGLTYALRYPEHCARLVLVGTFPTARPSVMLPPLFRALGWARMTKMLGRAAWWLVAFSWRRPTNERRRRLYAIWSTHQEGLPAIRARETKREERLGLPLDNDNVRASQRAVTTLDLTDRLATITCPVLVVFGDRDAASVWSGRVYAERLRDVEIIAFSQIGHDPFFEVPRAARDAVRRFIRNA